MAWTDPRTWITGETVTAALLNTHLRDNLDFLETVDSDTDLSNSRTFTNGSYADLDALTGGSGTVDAVSVSVTTGTRALVVVSAGNLLNSGGITLLSYRVSGDSTLASADTTALRNGSTNNMGSSSIYLEAGLTAGDNVFELQARVTAGTGTLAFPRLIVIPLPGA